MGLEISKIIGDFKKQLEQKQAEKQLLSQTSDLFNLDNDTALRLNSGIDDNEDGEEDIRRLISENREEFADMLIEMGVADTDVRTLSVDELMSMQCIDGKLYTKKEADELADKDESLQNEMQSLNNMINEECEVRQSDTEEAGETQDTHEQSSMDTQSAPDDTVAPSESSDTTATMDVNDINITESASSQTAQISSQEQNAESTDSSKPERTNTYQQKLRNMKGNINLTTEQIDSYTNKRDIVRDLYRDEDIIEAIDEDKDGKISLQERLKFESYIKGDDEKLTLEHYKEAAKKIKDGEFDKEEYKNYKIPDKAKEEKDKIQEAAKTSQASSAGSAGGGGGSNAASAASQSDPTDIKQMNLDQLKVAKAKEESNVNTEKSNLEKAYSGSDAEIQAAQKDCDEAKDSYKEAMKGESEEAQKLEEQRQTIEDEIIDATKEVDEQTKIIDETQEQIYQKNVEIMTCEANIEALKSALASYDGASAKDSSGQQKMDDKKAEIEQQIAALEEQKAALEEQKAALEEQQVQNQQMLQEKQTALSDKETAEQDIISQIKECVSDKTKETLDAFNNAKTQLKTVRDNQIKTYRDAVKKAQEKVADIDKLIIEKEAQQLERENSSFDPVRDAIDPNTKMQSVYLAGPPEMQVMIPEGMDLNGKELTAMVFLHGDGQNPENMGDGDYTRLDSVSTPAGTNWKGYNGIVIIPRAGYNWENGISEDTLKQCINSVQNATGCTIQTGNMVLMGASRGGAGVLNTASQAWAKNYFGAAVAISAFSGSTNNVIPLITSWGTNGDGGAGYTSNVGSQIQMPVPADHNYVVRALFEYDSNGNGVPDVMERAYGLMR